MKNKHKLMREEAYHQKLLDLQVILSLLTPPPTEINQNKKEQPFSQTKKQQSLRMYSNLRKGFGLVPHCNHLGFMICKIK